MSTDSAPHYPFPTLFDDANLVVIDKPAGLLSQGDVSGDESVVSLLQVALGRPYVGLIHRLDRNTSGALVIAKRTKAAQRLTQQLQQGELERTYFALVEGTLPSGQALHWRHWLLKNEATNTTRVFLERAQAPAAAKQAALRLEVLGSAPPSAAFPKGLSACAFELETGRSHQIRAQCAAEGHPIVGDPKYGRLSQAIARPALHSWKLSLNHPISKERLHLVAPLPRDIQSLWNPR